MFIGKGKRQAETPADGSAKRSLTQDEMIEILLGEGAKGGYAGSVNITKEKALTIAAVFRAVSILSGTLASFPWYVYRRDFNNNANWNIDSRHPLYFLLHDQPHHLWSSFTWREIAMLHLVLADGNFYAIIQRDADGEVTGLRIVENPGGVNVVLTTDDQVFYFIPDYLKPFPARDIFHVRGLGTSLLKGSTPLSLARETVGSGLTLQKFGERVFQNGTQLGGAVEVPGLMDDIQYKRFKESWQESYGGIINSGKTAILEGGAKFNPIGMKLVDAQFLESRKFSVSEVARFFGLPPHMLMLMDGATFSNIEHQGIELVKYTFLQWVKRFEAEAARKLVRPSETGYISTKLNMDGLLRGDSVARATSLSTYVNGGIMTRDEARALENLNAMGGYASQLLYPLNVASEEKLKKELNNE